MSVAQAVRFKSLLTELSKKDQRQFILQLFENDNSFIFKVLFHYCCRHTNHAQKINEMISKINACDMNNIKS